MTYEATTEEITVVPGVEVDLTVRDVGAGERDADKVLMDLQERLGVLAAAFDAETPPDALDEIPEEFVPAMTVAWDRRFDTDEGAEVQRKADASPTPTGDEDDGEKE